MEGVVRRCCEEIQVLGVEQVVLVNELLIPAKEWQ